MCLWQVQIAELEAGCPSLFSQYSSDSRCVVSGLKQQQQSFHPKTNTNPSTQLDSRVSHTNREKTTQAYIQNTNTTKHTQYINISVDGFEIDANSKLLTTWTTTTRTMMIKFGVFYSAARYLTYFSDGGGLTQSNWLTLLLLLLFVCICI